MSNIKLSRMELLILIDYHKQCESLSKGFNALEAARRYQQRITELKEALDEYNRQQEAYASTGSVSLNQPEKDMGAEEGRDSVSVPSTKASHH